MSRLQSVQNAAARLITGIRRCGHIMPLLRLLHWLPVRHHVKFKVATLVHWSLSGKFCITLSWWPSSTRGHSWVTTTLHREPDMHHYPDPQHLWWQSFCSRRSQAMEQFTATSQRCWFTIQSVLAVTRDIFVCIVLGGHGTVWTILTVPSRNNFTYLQWSLHDSRTAGSWTCVLWLENPLSVMIPPTHTITQRKQSYNKQSFELSDIMWIVITSEPVL